MSIIKTFTEVDFINEFERSSLKNRFSLYALEALYSLLDGLSGEGIEFDLIAICCDFTEYDSKEYLLSVYSDYDSLEDIQNNTYCIELSNGAVLIANF